MAETHDRRFRSKAALLRDCLNGTDWPIADGLLPYTPYTRARGADIQLQRAIIHASDSARFRDLKAWRGDGTR
jgi:hypothetical protein